MSAPALKTGDTLLGRYVLTQHLGEGLGGETWKAIPSEGGAPVAIKIVVGGGPSGRSHRDLLNEASFLRELEHPNVVSYLGVVDLPGTEAAFLVTAFAEGGNLWEWVLARGPCPAGLASRLLLQIADALDAVHARGILHRDLKPQNVLVRPVPGGLPVLMVADFGISRRMVADTANLTRHVGTIGYGAPEVWRSATISAAADVFSLGALGWFLLTAADPEPRKGAMQPDPVDLPPLLPEITRIDGEQLVALVAEMLALDAEARPPLRDVRHRLLDFIDTHQPGRRTGPPAVLAPPGPAAAPRLRAAAREDATREDPFVAPRTRSAERTMVPIATDSITVEPPAERPSNRYGAALLAGLALLVGIGGAVWLWPDPPDPPPAPPVVAMSAPAPTPPPELAPAAEAAPPVPEPVTAPRPAARAPPIPEPVPAPAPAPEHSSGPVGKLRVAVDSPTGLPADATVLVIAPDGARREVSSTQVLLADTRSGMATVEVRTVTRTLGKATVFVPAQDEVKVLCKALAADFAGMRCAALD